MIICKLLTGGSSAYALLILTQLGSGRASVYESHGSQHYML